MIFEFIVHCQTKNLIRLLVVSLFWILDGTRSIILIMKTYSIHISMTSGHVDSGSISRPEKIKSVSLFVRSCNVNSE